MKNFVKLSNYSWKYPKLIKYFASTIIVLFVFQFLAFSQEKESSHSNNLTIKGPYLGQNPPGTKPRKFAPGFFDPKMKQKKLFFSNDLHELYFTQSGESFSSVKIYCTKENDGIWENPEIMPFSKEYINNEISLSPDNKKLFFISNRPASNNPNSQMQPDIWYVEKDANGIWGDPMNIGPIVNTPGVEVQPAIDSNNNIYFVNPNGILFSKLVNGSYTTPYPVTIASNIEANKNSGPCPSIDNSYLIFHSNREGGYGSWDLYVSFKSKSGDWMDPVNLGDEINTTGIEDGASFSPDGKYIFFSRDGKMHWVSARIVEKYRPATKRKTKIKSPKLIGDYLGQEPPGIEAKIFAPGYISTDSIELNAVFSPCGKEFLFTRKINNRFVIFIMKQQASGKWSTPKILIENSSSHADPAYDPNNKRIYYVSNEPKTTVGKPHHIFYIERSGKDWGKPVKMEEPVNSVHNEVYPTFTKSGIMYFNSNRDGNKDIFKSIPIDGEYKSIEKLGKSINTEFNEGDVFVNPEEEFLIFNSKNGIHISTKNNNGQWTQKKLMGKEINLSGNEYTPMISPDGKYLFFTRNNDLYWISSEILNKYLTN